MRLGFWKNGCLEERLLEIGRLLKIAESLKKAKSIVERDMWYVNLAQLLGGDVEKCLKECYGFEKEKVLEICYAASRGKTREIERTYKRGKNRLAKKIADSINDALSRAGIADAYDKAAIYFDGIEPNGKDNAGENNGLMKSENGMFFVDIGKLAERMEDIGFAARLYANLRMMNGHTPNYEI